MSYCRGCLSDCWVLGSFGRIQGSFGSNSCTFINAYLYDIYTNIYSCACIYKKILHDIGNFT